MTFVIITALAGIISGLLILGLGNWKKLGIKFAAVILSIFASLYLLIAALFREGEWTSITNIDIIGCIVRNIAFILFHIAAGRDAITIKYRDRRARQ